VIYWPTSTAEHAGRSWRLRRQPELSFAYTVLTADACDGLPLSEAQRTEIEQWCAANTPHTSAPDAATPASARTETPEQIAARYVLAVQAHMDTRARASGYDNLISAVSYADEPAVPRFQQEGRAFRAWRSLVWEASNALQSEILAGAQPLPTIPDFLAMLPTIQPHPET
jgi:hypothetical protein